MSIPFWKIQKISKKLEKEAHKFCSIFERLLSTFGKVCKDDENFKLLNSYWDLAKSAAGLSTCAVSIAEKINIYRDDILAENVDKLYREQYEKHIIPGTNPNTEKLIFELVGVFRSAWDKSDEQNKDTIKQHFKKIAQLSPKILELDKEIADKKK